MANDLTVHPMKIDSTGSMSTDVQHIKKVIWSNSSTANHNFTITDKRGTVKLDLTSRGAGDTVIVDFYEPLYSASGFTISVIDSGIAYIY
jgi:hypothetical protein